MSGPGEKFPMQLQGTNFYCLRIDWFSHVDWLVMMVVWLSCLLMDLFRLMVSWLIFELIVDWLIVFMQWFLNLWLIDWLVPELMVDFGSRTDWLIGLWKVDWLSSLVAQVLVFFVWIAKALICLFRYSKKICLKPFLLICHQST